MMALDVGERRTGVALSDPLGMLATPLTTIESESESAVIGEVTRLAADNDVGEIIVGMPRMLSGRLGPQARVVARLVASLAERASVPVKTVDERYTSVEAERIVRESGGSPSRNRARVDAVAAAIILQSYLDSRQARQA